MSPIDKFLKEIEEDKRKELERIRKIAIKVIPEAEEVISYGMPTLKYKGKAFLGFNAHKNHIGIYPYGGEEIEVFKEKLKSLNFHYSSGAIQVPFEKPIPEDLLIEIVNYRINRIKNSNI